MTTTSFYHKCPKCHAVNVDSVERKGLKCQDPECKSEPLRLLTLEEFRAYHHERAPVGPPDNPKAKRFPILMITPPEDVTCAVCGGGLPFNIPANAPEGTSWRCSTACSLAVPANA